MYEPKIRIYSFPCIYEFYQVDLSEMSQKNSRMAEPEDEEPLGWKIWQRLLVFVLNPDGNFGYLNGGKLQSTVPPEGRPVATNSRTVRHALK